MNRLVWTCLALAIIASVAPAGARAEGDLRIIQFDVGQGDSTLIIAPSGKTMLIDGGNQGRGTKVIVPGLERLGIDKLDYVIATHYDADHIAGLDEVLKFLIVPPGAVFDPGGRGPLKARPMKTDAGNNTRYADYVIAADLSATREATPLGRGVIDLGDGVIVTVVAANGCVLGAGKDQVRPRLDENGASVALVVTYGTFDYFVGGDLTGGGRSGDKITEDMETSVAAKVGHVDVLRLSHHGSNTSSNKEFLETLRPTVAVVSVGDGHPNTKYRHPARRVLDRLHDIKPLGLKAVFATNEGETSGGLSAQDRKLLSVVEQDVVIRSDGSRFSVNGKRYRTDGAISPAAAATVPLNQTCTTHLKEPGNADSS